MFSAFFIDRPVFACCISIVIVLVGLVSIPSLPIAQTPDITPPTVKVSANYPGASAKVVADTVAQPIEAQVNGVDHMLYMESTCSDDGSMNLTVSFEVGTDVDMASVLVQNRVAIAEPQLPDEVKRQGVTTKKQSTNIVLMVNMISPPIKGEKKGRFDEIALSNYVTQAIKDELARLPGVGEVQIFGAKDFGMRLWLDPDLLKARDLTANDVISAVQEQNIQVAAGQIGAEPAPPGQVFQYTINTLGRLDTVEEFENIILKIGSDGQVLRVRDVATVELGAQGYNWYGELDGQPSIPVGIFQLPGANALDVANEVRTKMEELKKSFPEGMDYTIVYDTTKFVTASITEVINTLVIAIILVILTVYVFLQDLRTTLIPCITIPVSLIGTFAFMKAIGMSINTLSLFGLVLAIGIVVDDAIVVVENVMRIIDTEGLDRKAATKKAMQEITGPVVATTLVLMAVFVPTAMMGGITGRLYQQFAITISISTVLSSINALTLSPALCGMLLRPTREARNPFFKAFNKVFDISTAGYKKLVHVVVRRTAVMAILFLGILGATWFGFISVPSGFIPEEDQGYIMVNTTLPEGSSLQRTRKSADLVRETLENTPGVANVITVGGYSLLDSIVIPNSGASFVPLKPWDERNTPETQVDAIIQSVQMQFMQQTDGFSLALNPPAITGLGNASGFDFRLEDRQGVGLKQLEDIASDVVATATADPVLQRLSSSFRSSVPQLYVDVDRTKAKRLDIPLSTIFNTMQTCLGSMYINDFNLNNRVYRVMAQARAQNRATAGDIEKLWVRDNNGNMVPLSTLVTVHETAGPQTIFRYNAYNASTIRGNPAPGYSSGQAIQAMEKIAKDKLPNTMGYDWSGITYQQIKSSGQAGYIFAMAVVFVFLFLAAQYESWSIPFAVIFSVPLGIFGAIMGTWLRSFDNNIYTQIGLVLLIGMASKSAILIVEFAKVRREEGEPIRQAAEEAAALRFRAILMTAFSFILGVIPLVIASGAGANSRQSLGTAVFAGMLASTVLGVIIVPVLYVAVQGTKERLFKPRQDQAKKS